MADATQFLGRTERLRDVRIISLIGAAHFVSHAYILVLPPLFAFVRADYHVDYAELGLAIAAFNIVSMSLQIPMGFLVDRLGPRNLLIGGLVLSGVGMTVAGLIASYWALVAGFAIAGIANTVYHPADYSIMAHAISTRRMGQAFSVHTFLGMAGQAAAPSCMLLLASLWGWHGAVLGAAILAYGVALLLLVQKNTLADDGTAKRRGRGGQAAAPEVGWRVLLSGPILRNFFFFILLSMATSGMYTFTIAALGALYGTPLALANIALTTYLISNALGVLSGGIVADRFRNPSLIVTLGLAASGVAVLVIALVDFAATPLILMMVLAGFLNGMIMPSRDMLVRAVTPPGAFGRIFGFVSTGFSVSGVAAPLLFGWLMDQGQPRAVFLTVVAFTAATLFLVRSGARKPVAA